MWRLAGLGDLRFHTPGGNAGHAIRHPTVERRGFGVIVRFLHPVRLMESVFSMMKRRIPTLSQRKKGETTSVRLDVT
jgi:hypothetical protein